MVTRGQSAMHGTLGQVSRCTLVRQPEDSALVRTHPVRVQTHMLGCGHTMCGIDTRCVGADSCASGSPLQVHICDMNQVYAG